MLWFYMVALLFVVGAELNAELLKLQAAHEQPATTAMPKKVKALPLRDGTWSIAIADSHL